jgi:hypothetical protein
MSSAGAVMLKIAVIVSVLPIPIRSRQLQKATTSQTALTGVCVKRLTLLQNLSKVSLCYAVKRCDTKLTLIEEKRHRERMPKPFAHSPASQSNR